MAFMQVVDEGLADAVGGPALGDNAAGFTCAKCFIERRIPSLYDALRSGKPHMIDDECVPQWIGITLHIKPANGLIRWSVRTVASHPCSEACVEASHNGAEKINAT